MKRTPLPKFLVYVVGHLRSFALISHRQRQQWDEFSAGEPYLVFLHTWTALDHHQRVWWQNAEQLKSRSKPPRINVSALLDDPHSNGLRDRLASSLVEEHPGLPGPSSSDNARCYRGFTCASDVAIQLEELGRVHKLGQSYMAASGLAERLGERRLNDLPVIRTRPDVTVRTNVAHRRGKGIDEENEVANVTFPAIDTLSLLKERMHAKRDPSNQSPLIFGYRGPWWGGWGDIAWASTFDGISRLVSSRSKLPQLLERAPLAVDTLPPFNERVSASLREAHETRSLRAELVWMHYLRQLNFRPYFFRFCHVARYRLGSAASDIRRVRLESLLPVDRLEAIRSRLSLWRKAPPVVGIALHMC
jgi:hypothetical protein